MEESEIKQVQASVSADIKKKMPSISDRIAAERKRGVSLLGTAIDDLARIKLLTDDEPDSAKKSAYIRQQEEAVRHGLLLSNSSAAAAGFDESPTRSQSILDSAKSQAPIANLLIEIVNSQVDDHLGKGKSTGARRA